MTTISVLVNIFILLVIIGFVGSLFIGCGRKWLAASLLVLLFGLAIILGIFTVKIVLDAARAYPKYDVVPPTVNQVEE